MVARLVGCEGDGAGAGSRAQVVSGGGGADEANWRGVWRGAAAQAFGLLLRGLVRASSQVGAGRDVGGPG